MTRQLNDNDRLRVRVLFHDARFTKKAICATTGFSMHQVKNAIRNPAVKPRSGRPPALSPEDEAALLAFVRAHPTTVPLTYAALAEKCFGGKHGVYAIRSTLRRHGCTPTALRLRGKTTTEGTAAALAEATEAARAARAAAAATKAKAMTTGTTTTTMTMTTEPTATTATTTPAETTTAPAAPASTTPLTALAMSALTSTEPHDDELDEDDEMDDEDDEDSEDESEDEQRTLGLGTARLPTAPQP